VCSASPRARQRRSVDVLRGSKPSKVACPRSCQRSKGLNGQTTSPQYVKSAVRCKRRLEAPAGMRLPSRQTPALRVLSPSAIANAACPEINASGIVVGAVRHEQANNDGAMNLTRLVPHAPANAASTSDRFQRRRVLSPPARHRAAFHRLKCLDRSQTARTNAACVKNSLSCLHRSRAIAAHPGRSEERAERMAAHGPSAGERQAAAFTGEGRSCDAPANHDAADLCIVLMMRMTAR